ncbi:MAG TPA: aminodeoxychorismate/anthranilate synthase component II [Saprospiraceae bacterium]|nr:aminodeoxychorismate/anthranilate synthase component II [Saprospiraceae bacterium]
MKVLLIDNYDSFTYNLAQLLTQTGLCEYHVALNDQIALGDVDAYDKILISPGPGLPGEAGITCDIIRRYASEKSILGICLGHQAIAEVFGARLFQMPAAQHGQTVETSLVKKDDPLFTGLPDMFVTTLYHSWAVDPASIPLDLLITATSSHGHIMGLRHARYAVWGLQFHPESIATEYGLEMMRNWLNKNHGRWVMGDE